MSLRLSPDGMYYWDGQRWQSTLSPDGRYRWNGSEWQPAPGAFYAGVPATLQPSRQPTSWTRPLQLGVVAWYVWSAIYVLATPLWMGGLSSQLMHQSLQNQEQFSPYASPPPAAFVEMMNSLVNTSMWIAAFFYAIVFAFIIFGTTQRWPWIYYTVLVLLGLTAVMLPLDLVYLLVGRSFGPYASFAPPRWLYLLNVLTGIPGVALFVWMLVALIRRGPWAMTLRPAS